ncbi:MAG: general stress protein [Pseudomonadota bacterium]|nr:hypothetical protein [Gammaproteobacteria bacterium]MEC8009288.1 general stress protein [Pseudomonadota bacterium]|tara:strand:- start:1408 stop:1941 length:534 start_codon:yes stop_codon:yes gene_type:complete
MSQLKTHGMKGEGMNQTVVQVYKNAEDASATVDYLHLAGIPDDQISVVMTDHAKERFIEIRENAKLPKNVTVGAVAGSTIGAVATGLAAVGTVALSGGTALVAAGPITAALASMYVGAGIGAVVGGFAGLRYSDKEVERMEQDIQNGGVLVAVEIDKEEHDAVLEIMKQKQPEEHAA